MTTTPPADDGATVASRDDEATDDGAPPSVALVRGPASARPAWQRPPPNPTPFTFPIPVTTPTPTPVTTLSPTSVTNARPEASDGPSAPERAPASAGPVVPGSGQLTVLALTEPHAGPTLTNGTATDAGQHDERHDDPAGGAALVRKVPRRPLQLAALLGALVLVVVSAVVLVGRRPVAAASTGYAWHDLPAPVLSRPQPRWAIDLPDGSLDGVASDTTTVFLAQRGVGGLPSTVSALDASDGHRRWQADVRSPGSSVQQLVLSGDLVIAVSGSNGLRSGVSAFDARSGERRWQVALDASWATVVAGTDPVLVLGGPSPRYATSARAVDVVTGEVRWSRDGVVGDLDGSRLALVEGTDALTVDIADGRETARWRGVAAGDQRIRSVVVSDDRVVVLTENELRLAGIGARRADGSLDPGIGQLFTTIRSDDDHLTVLSQSGVAGIDLRNGRISWTRAITLRAIGRAEGQTILLGWSEASTDTMVTIDARDGSEQGVRVVDGLTRRPRDRRSLWSRAAFLADGATYLVSNGGVRAYDLPALQPLWDVSARQLGAAAGDVAATEAGLLVSTTDDRLVLLR